MNDFFSEEKYMQMIQALFCRFPSFQKSGASAYKPGIANMEFADQLLGHPHRRYRIIHVAGTNGKGSVSNMLASVLAAAGMKVGLYTSPHISDFRERIRIIAESSSPFLIPKEDVWDFIARWKDTFDHLDMSFFEITTLMALDWFAGQEVDAVVLETGLGGRLDSTNIVSPILSVITNIGKDHCDMLGETLPEIAFEKAGIIKPLVPVVVGESHPETDPVFERKVLYTNISEPQFMGDRQSVMSLLTFADKTEPFLMERSEDILAGMDLKGDYQRKNLRTVLAAMEVLRKLDFFNPCPTPEVISEALTKTAARTGFRGRWERISQDPLVICDIGHNEHGLKYNFSQLDAMRKSGEITDLIMVYGSVADKDVESVVRLLPEDAVYIFTQADGKRALPAEELKEKYSRACAESGRPEGTVYVCRTVAEAVEKAYGLARSMKTDNVGSSPLIYIGGSTYVVSEAISAKI